MNESAFCKPAKYHRSAACHACFGDIGDISDRIHSYQRTLEGVNIHPLRPLRQANQKSELKSACQPHDVVRVNLGLKCSQAWQILPIYIDERGFGVHIVPIQRRGVIPSENSGERQRGRMNWGNFGRERVSLTLRRSRLGDSDQTESRDLN